jgi:hypothetical protein
MLAADGAELTVRTGVGLEKLAAPPPPLVRTPPPPLDLAGTAPVLSYMALSSPSR